MARRSLDTNKRILVARFCLSLFLLRFNHNQSWQNCKISRYNSILSIAIQGFTPHSTNSQLIKTGDVTFNSQISSETPPFIALFTLDTIINNLELNVSNSADTQNVYFQRWDLLTWCELLQDSTHQSETCCCSQISAINLLP